MVLGLRSKNRKGTSVRLDYLIHVQEIKPWPPSQSLKSAQSLLLQWENGDQSSGSFTSNVGDGKVEFGESFRLSVTLCKEVSRKGTVRDSFLKNHLEFNLFESRKDKAMKGQLLGSAVINLADYGIIMAAVTINAPINFKKSSRSMVPVVLYVNVQPFDRDKSSLSKEVSLDKDGSETVSEVTNEGNDDETEIASFTDDEYDDYNVSSHSSLTVSSSALESSKGSPSQSDKRSGTAQSGTRRIDVEPALPRGVAPSNPEANSAAQGFKHRDVAAPLPLPIDMSSNPLNPVNNLAENVMLSDDCSQVGKNSNHVSLEESQTKQDADRKAWRHEMSGLENATTDNLNGDLMDDKGQGAVICEVKKPALKEKLLGQLPEDASKKQAKLRSNTLALNRTAIGLQGNTRRDKLKHLKSVQLQFHSAEGEDPFINNQFKEKAQKMDTSENVNEGVKGYAHGEREKSTKGGSDKQGESNSKVEILEEELSGAAAKDGLAKQGNSTKMFQLMEKEKEIDLPGNVNKVDMSYAPNKREEQTKNNFSGNKVELESRVEMLEEELMEAAAVEVGLYSVVAEHGSSINKVLAPARRLSRFYLHACKAGAWAKRANAARAITSGLILVSKACGNDVPRLTFWLSNSIVLRAIVSQAVEKLQVASAPSIINNGGPKGRHKSSLSEEKTNQTESSDEWAEPQPYIAALEKVEAWIFSRLVESVWWQTLTPHMQSAAVKSSNSRKTHVRRHGLGDQEQGNFAIDLWKKAFRDACERLCPVRAGGHECGCLSVLSRLVMEQLVSRLDVAMFNAILRESADEMPTDPVSDPISDPKVLPIPAGSSSFGAGAQLKNAVGNWSRWLTDLFGIDDSDSPEEKDELDSNRRECETSFKVFHLLNALSDLMMLPFEMLADRSTRKEVCPAFGAPIIKRVLENFVPDEFNPDPIPETILEALDSEDLAEVGEESITNFPCTAVPTIYSPPPAASLKNIVGEVGGQTLQRSRSAMLRKSYTSDDELDELDSPMASIIDNSKSSPGSTAWNWMQNGKAGRKVVRYKLLREVWKDGE